MGCCPPSSTFGFEHIFSRIPCVLACCGGKLVVQNSEFCDEENTSQHLPRRKSTRKFRWFICCLQSSQRESEEQDIAQTSPRLVESAGCIYSSETREKTLQEKPTHRSWNRCPVSSGFGRSSKSQSLKQGL